MKVHVIVGVYQGLISDIRAFEAEHLTKMEEVERKLCEEHDVPYDDEKRKEYRMGGGENDVLHFIVDLE